MLLTALPSSSQNTLSPVPLVLPQMKHVPDLSSILFHLQNSFNTSVKMYQLQNELHQVINTYVNLPNLTISPWEVGFPTLPNGNFILSPL